VHVRRALLLFAVVLGLAALATSVSRPARENSRDSRSAAPAAPQAGPAPEFDVSTELRLPGPRGGHSAALRSGEAATLLVSVPEPGEVDLPSFGLSSPAEPLTPARFELFGGEPGVHRVRFTPAEGGEARDFGRVVVR